MKKSQLLLVLLVLFLVPGFLFLGCSKEETQTAAESSETATESKAEESTSEAAVETDPVEEAALNYFADFPGNRIIKPEDVFAKMDAGEDMLLLDIRRAEDYDAGHLKGAVNAPWGPAIADALDWLPDDKPVYVYCYSGQTAGQTTSVLNVAGIQAQSIRYGWNLGISKAEGYDAYTETEKNLSPDASGVKYNEKIRAAVEDYFNAIPDKGSNIWPASKVKEAMDAEEDIFILSIRQPDAYAEGHIQGAVNIPWGQGMQEKFADTLPKDKLIVTYCYSGQTAGQTVGILRLLGYNTVSLKSGMGTAGTGNSGWANEGFPVVQ